MTKPRAVLDTNVVVAAALSRNPASPNTELLQRLAQGEFDLLTCFTLYAELAEKLSVKQVSLNRAAQILALINALAEWVTLSPDDIEPLLPDPDDNVVIACAVIGHAHYLVTYDPHFDGLGGEYQGIKIVKALPFLWVVRGDTPAEA